MGAKEDHENLLGIASRAFGDAADQVEDFVKSGMESLGYKPRIEWEDPEPDTGGQPPQRRGPSFAARQAQQPPVSRQRQVGGGGGNNGGRGEYGG